MNTRNRKHRKLQSEFVAWLKEALPCVHCGGYFPAVVMDLDHREPADKRAGVGSLVGRVAWEILLEEIQKCDPLCANCHRMHTHYYKHHMGKDGDQVPG